MQCADIVFNSTAQLLADDQCKNGTGVSAQHIGNLEQSAANGTNTSSGGSSTPSSAAGSLMAPVAGSGLLAALLAWGLL